MSQAEEKDTEELAGNLLFDQTDPSQTLDACGKVVDFIGLAVQGIPHVGGEVDGDAVSILCLMVAQALQGEKVRSEKLEKNLLARLRKAEGGAQ